MNNRITSLLNITYPIIQGGMVWCSGWKLASAVTKAGGLGVIGAGSMYPDVLDQHITKLKEGTDKTFAVNIPLMKKDSDELIEIVIKHHVPVVITSAGSPKKYTATLQKEGIKVIHVVANTKFAVKCEEAGVDAIVAEGFEAGGHNGREETTSLTLIPLVKQATSLPLIAAGGFYDAKSMLAAMVLGAEGIQIGSRFAISKESSAHDLYKQRVIEAKEGDTVLTLKQLAPVRFIKNKFYDQVTNAEAKGATVNDMQELLGKGRARLAIFEGNLDDGEIEIGQSSALLNKVESASTIINEITAEFNTLKNNIFNQDKFNF